MMKKYLELRIIKSVSLGIIILFFIGCNSNSNTQKQTPNLNVGFQGLDLQFSDKAPPPRVFEKSNFPILMIISNKGTYDIKDPPAAVSISLEKEYVPSFTLDGSSPAQKVGENEVTFKVDGKSQLNPNGDQILIELLAKTGSLEQQSELKPTTLAATLCYPYKTTLSTTMCIDPDLTGLRQEKKVCEVKDQSFSTGQGAPLAITKIESFMLAEADENNMRPQFIIYLENRGPGNPVNIANYRSICSSGKSEKTNDLWNSAYLKAYTTGNDELDCEPGQDLTRPPVAGFVKLRDGKDYVRCTFKNPISRNAQAYTSPLRIEIDYGYVETKVAGFVMQKTLSH